MKRFTVAVISALCLAFVVSPAVASAAHRIHIRTIGEDWCVERIVIPVAQKTKGKLDKRGGERRGHVDPVVWLEGWIEGSKGQYLLGI